MLWMSRGYYSILRPLRSRTFLAGVSVPSLYLCALMSSTKSRNGSTSTTGSSWASTTFQPQQSEFPYTEADFMRHDPTSDEGFYSTPRFVTHIDEAAIKSLGRYYDAALPSQGRVLDFCSSWISHYPKRIENACKQGDMTVVGMGMNDAEFVPS